VGLRPGEKLFEELNCKGEAYHPTRHPRIMRFVTVAGDGQKISAALQKLGGELHRAGPDQLKQLLRQHLAEYTPDLGANGKPARATMPVAGHKLPPESKLAANPLTEKLKTEILKR
jgi:hypothetical protein